MIKQFISLIPQKDQEILNVLAARPKAHIWILGAAGIGVAVKRCLEGKGFDIYSFCDNDESKVGTVVDGISVRSFVELCQDDNRVVLVSVWKYFDEVSHQCDAAGITFYDATPLAGVVFDTTEESASFVSQNLQRISSIAKKLSDNTSTEIYLTAQIARLFRDRGTMRKYKGNTQYIEQDIAPIGSSELVFVCGAGNGSAAVNFAKLTDGNAVIHCFEPDQDNFQKLRDTASHTPNLRCVPCGVGEKSGVLSFCGGMGDNSTFSSPGEGFAQVTTIDDYAETHGAIPSLITMDIEGWEMAALRGAQKIIARHKPKLAVSLYHRASDFVEIPEFIFRLRSDYTIYIRHYTDSYSDTIAYFV